MIPRELLTTQFKDDSLACPPEPRDEGASANDRGRLLLPSTLCHQQRDCNRGRLARLERHFFEFLFVAIAHTMRRCARFISIPPRSRPKKSARRESRGS